MPNKDLDYLLDRFEIIETSHLRDHGGDKAKLKSELLSLVLKALPEKHKVTKLVGKENWDNFQRIKGYNQAISEAEANIRKVLG